MSQALTDPRYIFIGGAAGPVAMPLNRANRHGVVAGATGTGKTVTLQILAQSFSDAGVPVFAADVKGDLSGIGAAIVANDKLTARAEGMGLTLVPQAAPVMFWDLYGRSGHPVRTTISEMGPMLLSRLMDLNDTQEGVMMIAFHMADEEGLLLSDLEDLQAILRYMAENAAAVSSDYGRVSPASVAAIQRRLLELEMAGAEQFFGEPALRLEDLMRTTPEGKGYVNILAADQLISNPRLYSTFLLWLLSELFEDLPEVGDQEKPRLVFFFDEAHLLFRDAPKALLEKIEQVVRLIRSKGVGVYFVTQNPADIPDSVLNQLGNRIQHALRAYTPAEQKGVRAAAQSFRPNPAFDTQETITQMGVGEALVSVLDDKGAPTMVARTKIRPPASRMGPLTASERQEVLAQSPVWGVYDQEIDRQSAAEILAQRAERKLADEQKAEVEKERETTTRKRRTSSRRSNRQGLAETMAKSAIRAIGSRLGREIVRGILGSLKR